MAAVFGAADRKTMRIGTLYILKNIKNNKVYVGKTYSCVKVRLNEHLSDSKRFPERKLYKAFAKYGFNNFVLEILGNYPEGDLEAKEIETILFFNSFVSGYNSTLGGDGKRYLQISDKEILDKYKELKYVAHVARYFKISEDSIFECLRSHNINIDKTSRPNSTPIRFPEYDMDFKSAAEAARFLQDCDIAPKNSDIRGIAGSLIRAAKGTRSSYKGITVEYC